MARSHSLIAAQFARLQRRIPQLESAIVELASHLQVMRASADNWKQAPLGLQEQLNLALTKAQWLQKELQRAVDESHQVMKTAPRSHFRSIRPGQRAPAFFDTASLRAAVRRLGVIGVRLDDELRAYAGKVDQIVNDPTRHGGAAPETAVKELVEVVDSALKFVTWLVKKWRGD